MAYKKIDNYFSFADIAIQHNADKNRSLIFLDKINSTINWKPVQNMLIKFYETGKSKEGERAYSPLLLFKCMLLQKWFQIKSDPELESQINDRISFKSFLDMPLDYPSPDHSTFSRFRKRLSKDAMVQINSLLLKQFYQLGISINKGVAVDARLVKSASKPVSKKKIKILKEKHDTPEGRLDQNGNFKKFTRDIDSDWTFKNDKYHYGLKEHAAVDTDNGFILSTVLSPSSHHDSKYLPYAVIYSMHTKDKVQTVYADKGYAGAPNREFLTLNSIKDGIMRKDNINAKLTDIEITRNKAISKYRYIVEQYFGISHKHDKGYRARFPQIMKNTIDIMFRQFAFNLRKGAKILGVIPV
ncbi:MAG: IS5 family transposase [Desulfobacteraceae bacterium]|nr:IS5 family transposase [Desulfobacteraceae bacterium]